MKKPIISLRQNGLNIFAVIAVTLAVFFAGQVLGAIAASLLPLAFGQSVEEMTNWLETTPGIFTTILLIEIATVGLLLWFMRFKKISLASVGINKLQVKYIGYALAGFAVYFLLYIASLVVVSVLVPGLDFDQEQDIAFSKTTTGFPLLLIFVGLVILPPLAEEFVMRGFLFSGLRKSLTYINATVVTSLLFALAHLPNGVDGLLWLGALDTFVLSLVLCYLREKTDSLWPPVGLHMLKNSFAFVILFNVSSLIR